MIELVIQIEDLKLPFNELHVVEVLGNKKVACANLLYLLCLFSFVS